MFRLSLILLCLVVAVTLEYEFKCPYSGEWRFRAVGFNCSINSQYVCIFKYPERTYHETCDGLDYSNIGSKLIYEPFFNKAYCSYEHYQPFPFSTDGNSKCVYQKSFCTEKGQYLFQRGSQRSDITCGCDLTKGYEFVTKPNHDCYCVPSEEDCSCHKLPCNNLVDQCPQDRDEMLTRSLFPTYKENGFKDAINIFDDENNGKTYRFQCLYISSVLLAAMIIVVILFFTFVDLKRRQDRTQHRNNYFRLWMLVVDVAYMVIYKYIKEKILGPDSFKTFLNKEKHKLVHIHETSPCCQCSKVSIKGEKLISKEQLQILYKSDERNQRRDHTKYAGNKLIQICICKYSAKENIDVRVVDITLANYIIQKCGKHERGIDNWIEQIKNVRNEIFHLPEITDYKFSTKWTSLEGSIMGIANVIDIEWAKETKKHIMHAKKPESIGEYMLKYETSCRDILQNTCAAIERAQNQVIEEKKDCQQTMRKIHSSIAVNISETEEDISELPDNSVNQQCSTTEPDDNSNAVNIFETKEEIDELQDNSVNQLSRTTEYDGVSTADNIIEKGEEMGKPPDISTKQKCSTTEPEGLLNAETTIETKEEMETPTDSSNNQDFSTTKPDEITPTTEEAIVQTFLKNSLPASANLRRRLKINKKHFWNKDPDIYSCIKTGNTLVFTDFENERLIICKKSDKHHMSLSYVPRYITLIDSNTVAVSCIGNTILIINIYTRSVTSTINTSRYCYGISYNDNNLYVVIDESIIHVMDLTGKVIRTIPAPSGNITDITVDRDRLVCIDYTSIYCCSLEGKVMWKFKKDEIHDLRRVTTDDEGNVYVTDIIKDIVVVVSDDGKHNRELLTKSDGLDRPYGIYFDKKENSLLVSNRYEEQVFLFDVKRKAT